LLSRPLQSGRDGVGVISRDRDNIDFLRYQIVDEFDLGFSRSLRGGLLDNLAPISPCASSAPVLATWK
jgi:hypothetical protein